MWVDLYCTGEQCRDLSQFPFSCAFVPTQGNPGQRGETGSTGSVGEAGLRGPDGAHGDKGPAGEKVSELQCQRRGYGHTNKFCLHGIYS